MRLFIAVDFDEHRQYFEQLQKQFLSAGSYTLPHSFHLTLKFLGEVDDSKVEEVTSALSVINTPSFVATTSSLGVFPGIKAPRVLWLGLEPVDKFVGLHKQIDQVLQKWFMPDSTFQPHLTLARIKSLSDNYLFSALLSMQTAHKEKKIDSFHLIKSTLLPSGPAYENLSSFSLG